VVKARILEGKVVSDRMNKTVTVLVKQRSPHKLYKRSLVKRKRFKVHDEKNEAKTGDQVRIVECRPISKEKYFRLVEIIK